MDPEVAFTELSEAKKIIENIIGHKVKGHRAPAFSVTPNTAWAFDVISNCGFEYDSSIMPIRGIRYGWHNFPKDIIKVNTNKGNCLIEVPISTINYFNKEVPFSGGGYLRLFPFFFIEKAYKYNNKNRSNILYIHPYELDYLRYPDYYFDALNNVSFLKRIKMKSNWINRKNTYSKLEKLLENNSFTTMNRIIEAAQINNNIKILKIDTSMGSFLNA